MIHRKEYIYYLIKLSTVTQYMIDTSQSTSISTARISKTNLIGDRYIALKFEVQNVPLDMEIHHSDEKITHEDLLLELGGSLWE
jgi:UDP-N-acetylglucosamine pyrophosphorylase